MSTTKVVIADAGLEGESVRIKVELLAPKDRVRDTLPMLKMALSMNSSLMGHEAKGLADKFLAELSACVGDQVTS